MPDMREKIRNYIDELDDEIDRLRRSTVDKLEELANATIMESYTRGIEYKTIESRVQTLIEVRNDLQRKLNEVI